jgi:molybdate transport system regulatory protein
MSDVTPAARARVFLRLRFATVEPALGPGKIELMEHIEREGSISAACRAMHMSYHRAWTIVHEMNGMFREPLVATQLGGTTGGGARVTPLGHEVVKRFRSIETCLWRFAADDIAALEAHIGEQQARAEAGS